MKNKGLIIILLSISFLLIASGLILPETFSKFNSSLEGGVKGEIAFYVIESDYQNAEINLDKIVPSANSYKYYFSVANYDKEKMLETDAQYNIVIRTTTNLNLGYKLYENSVESDIITSREFVEDKDGTYYYVMKTEKKYFGFVDKQINHYVLVVDFPLDYSNHEYQDVMDSLEIIILSSQVVE